MYMSVSKVVDKLNAIISKYEDAIAYLEKIRSKWLEYKSNFRCYTCSSKVQWIDDFTYKCENGHEGVVLGVESWEFGVPPWFMRVLRDNGLVEVLYKSRSSTCYGVRDSVLSAIESVLGVKREVIREEIIEETPPSPPPEELFSDIVGLEDVKELILNVLRANKPVHLLIIGPPASAKTMILEILAKYYNVPIILAGTSTRAGLRDFIVENRPLLMIIDELDKIENSHDLSVLLTWMESQRIVVTMATKKAYVTCPSVCKVIAAANRVDRIPSELLSRFIVVKLKPYTEEEVREICLNILTRREGVERELAETITRAVIEKLK